MCRLNTTETLSQDFPKATALLCRHSRQLSIFIKSSDHSRDRLEKGERPSICCHKQSTLGRLERIRLAITTDCSVEQGLSKTQLLPALKISPFSFLPLSFSLSMVQSIRWKTFSQCVSSDPARMTAHLLLFVCLHFTRPSVVPIVSDVPLSLLDRDTAKWRSLCVAGAESPT